jgi:hypothetical protein
MTCLAEATINPAFKDYRFIYDNVEDGMLIDLDRLFSEEVADRIEPPAVDGEQPVFSGTIEELYYHIDDAIKDGRPFIYIVDSMDALDSEAAEKKFYQHKKAARKEKDDDEKVAGSYGADKAKRNSEYLRKTMRGLRDTGSILIILSQTRDVLSGYGGRTRSGGRALRFYATIEIWSSIAQKIKKTVMGKEREIGVRVQLEVRKNRVTGKTCSVEIDIFPSFGIDDLGSCVDYLVEENWWEVEKQTIQAKDLGLAGTREKIIRLIEKRGLENKLRQLCGECWERVEEACAIRRKNRYSTEPPQ